MTPQMRACCVLQLLTSSVRRGVEGSERPPGRMALERRCSVCRARHPRRLRCSSPQGRATGRVHQSTGSRFRSTRRAAANNDQTFLEVSAAIDRVHSTGRNQYPRLNYPTHKTHLYLTELNALTHNLIPNSAKATRFNLFNLLWKYAHNNCKLG